MSSPYDWLCHQQQSWAPAGFFFQGKANSVMQKVTFYNISREQVPSKHFIFFEGDACIRRRETPEPWHNGTMASPSLRRTFAIARISTASRCEAVIEHGHYTVVHGQCRTVSYERATYDITSDMMRPSSSSWAAVAFQRRRHGIEHVCQALRCVQNSIDHRPIHTPLSLLSKWCSNKLVLYRFIIRRKSRCHRLRCVHCRLSHAGLARYSFDKLNSYLTTYNKCFIFYLTA